MNAEEFSSGLDDNDYELINIMDSMQQESVVKHFSKKKIKPDEFFLKTFGNPKSNEMLIKEIEQYMERRRSRILPLVIGKRVFEMANDGEPTWKELNVLDEPATVRFHFMRNEENTHYFPTINYKEEKVIWQYNNSYLLCKEPAWLVSQGQLFHFKSGIDGNKLAPFLNKKFILIPKNIEETYYKKFVAPLVAAHDVYAKGFKIKFREFDPRPELVFSNLAQSNGNSIPLFENEGSTNGNTNKEKEAEVPKILFELNFRYGSFRFNGARPDPISVSMERNQDDYTFYKIKREVEKESKVVSYLDELGLSLNNSKKAVDQPKAFSWLNDNRARLESKGFIIRQTQINGKKYFIGNSSITIEIKENIDWFDIYAIVRFGEYEMPFNELRKFIIKKKFEFKLPNGEIAVIPESWFSEYSEIFAFMEESENSSPRLKKHHLALVKDLEAGELAQVTMDRKLEALRNFEEIEDIPLPDTFRGTLRPYQKAGYNWLKFLNQYKFGGCLADDMGLGKTVQALAMLQAEKENGNTNASLLIMPTSLVYNWEMESKKFTPKLKILCYTGTQRDKDVAKFVKYDLVLTSYGITRLDIDILSEYYFNYVILDESQAIKNPGSNIAKSVKKLVSRNRLILTGTPLENSTMDLWSQMTFINPGLLGSQSFFKKEYLKPIEKDKNEEKTIKLFRIVKPFILRRNKSQVLDDLPDKVENIHYSSMTEMQEEKYEDIKSIYRNQILNKIDEGGIKSSQMLLLKGLTQLRQLANHPQMIDPEYSGDSGKMDDVLQMLTNALAEGHKILVFSQFVKHLKIFRDYLDNTDSQYAYLDGSTKNRRQQVEWFQNDKQCKIFLISLKAGGLGLNLTEADYVFILDPWWNPAVEAQAIDRAHRIGQKKVVFTYKFISKNSVEEKILSLQQRKKKLVSDLIHTEESFVKSLSRDDIESLLG
jgi:SNF2 family DNA or RNA helicase